MTICKKVPSKMILIILKSSYNFKPNNRYEKDHAITLILAGAFLPAPTQNADENNIKKVIADEVETFYANNYEKWADSFTKTPDFQRVSVIENGETVSWNWKQYNKYIKKSINQKFPNYSSRQDNYQVHVMGNLAVASFISASTWGQETLVRPKIYVLERIGEDWKISYYRTGFMENSTIPDGQ